jgi:hypothetical protein
MSLALAHTAAFCPDALKASTIAKRFSTCALPLIFNTLPPVAIA